MAAKSHPIHSSPGPDLTSKLLRGHNPSVSSLRSRRWADTWRESSQAFSESFSYSESHRGRQWLQLAFVNAVSSKDIKQWHCDSSKVAVAHSLRAECCVFLNQRGVIVSFFHRYEWGLVLISCWEMSMFNQKVAFFFWPNMEPWITCLILSAAWKCQTLEFNIGSHWATGQWGLWCRSSSTSCTFCPHTNHALLNHECYGIL